MATITQDMHYRLSLIRYAERFGVTKATIKYFLCSIEFSFIICYFPDNFHSFLLCYYTLNSNSKSSQSVDAFGV